MTTPPLDRDLTALLDPSSVAVLGASNDESKHGNWISVQAPRRPSCSRVRSAPSSVWTSA